MATENTNFTTRVYKYGVVFDHDVTLNFPDEAVKELRRINDLWNRLVDLNERTNEEIEAKYKKECVEYHQLVMQREEKYRLRKTKEQEFAHTRMIAGSISGKTPLISSAKQSIKLIKKGRMLGAVIIVFSVFHILNVCLSNNPSRWEST